MDNTAFRFEYDPGIIRHGRGCVAALGDELAGQDCTRALVVCGQTVGSTPAVMDPIKAGLGDRLVGIFDETTPAKRLDTAISGVERLDELDADALVAVGGGSSLDVAKVMSVVAASGANRDEIGTEFAATGTVTAPDGELPPILAVPTTLAGADLSALAGITASPDGGLVDEPQSGGVSDPRLMPAALFHDPALVETTPRETLTASAMNGFDKGVETLYAANATPITDGTAMRGLNLLWDGLSTLTDEPASWATEEILQGIICVQYGIARPEGTTLSLIHAFGHGLKATVEIQQGVAHAIVAPHALEYLFEQVDGRRELLARAFDIETGPLSKAEIGAAVIEEVEAVRDGLELPTQLRSVEGLERDELDAVAETTMEDGFLDNCPPGFEPTVEGLTGVLEAAW
jgi:alcohol dehydrogenase